ncbi:MAG: hypothetical protein ACTSQI_03050 [Candidatus Helarchaeota archaeon]
MTEEHEDETFSIQIEAIKTPLGEVPTLESFKRLIEGLNILNADMIRTQETVNSEVWKSMSGIEKELKSLRKIISEELIAHAAIKENINELNKRLEQIAKNQDEKLKELSKLLIDFIGSIRVFQETITRRLR